MKDRRPPAAAKSFHDEDEVSSITGNSKQPVILNYSTTDAPTLSKFHKSSKFVRGVMGPVGSGKSTACVLEILTRALEQKPASNGIRYTRWAIIRNSYPELKSTTLKTWGLWCPPQYGKLTVSSPIRHHIRTDNLDIEVYFLALDKEEDSRKLLSLELTGAWINEAREINKSIVDLVTTRVGRYPPTALAPFTWKGLIMDTNPPDDQHWWYRLAEENCPENWQFFKQPSGISSKAENVTHLAPDYYKDLMQGKDDDWVKVYVKGQYGYVTEGRPVFSSYRDNLHATNNKLEADPALPLFIGVDFGLTPTAVIGQRLSGGRWHILDEYCTEDTGLVSFFENFSKYMSSHYEDFEIQGAYGDPTGRAKTGMYKETAFEVANEYFPLDRWNKKYSGGRDAKWKEAPTNEIDMRLEAVRNCLNKLIDGKPGIILGPKCKILRKGFVSGYHYKLVRKDSDQYSETPAKNRYSHPMDALQYLLLGGGEHNVVLRKVERQKASSSGSMVVKDTDYKIFG